MNLVGMNVLRTSSSRILGVVLVITSAVLFLVAFVTNFLPFELASLISFILGIALLAVELESRVRISVAADGILGYLHALDSALSLLKVTGRAAYVPSGERAMMVMTQEGANSKVELPPVGEGLQNEIASQVGDMKQKGIEFFKMWIPKALVDNLSIADRVEVANYGNDIRVTMGKPFVRSLCVDPFVNAKVCCRMGCPLAGAVALSLAVTTGKEVQFENCSYDPKTQRALTSLTLGKSE